MVKHPEKKYLALGKKMLYQELDRQLKYIHSEPINGRKIPVLGKSSNQ
jgi:hypothetical protein